MLKAEIKVSQWLSRLQKQEQGLGCLLDFLEPLPPGPPLMFIFSPTFPLKMLPSLEQSPPSVGSGLGSYGHTHLFQNTRFLCMLPDIQLLKGVPSWGWWVFF